MQDPRARHAVGVAKSAIRHLNRQSAHLNRQSTISIDNRHSQSTIDNLKIRNLQSEIGNQLCHNPPRLTLYKSERIRAGGDVSLDLHGSRDR
jgi:predicted Zn-dependent protease with MMP-like domain